MVESTQLPAVHGSEKHFHSFRELSMIMVLSSLRLLCQLSFIGIRKVVIKLIAFFFTIAFLCLPMIAQSTKLLVILFGQGN